MAKFAYELMVDVTELAPFITWGTNPEMGVAVAFPEAFPDIKK